MIDPACEHSPILDTELARLLFVARPKVPIAHD